MIFIQFFVALVNSKFDPMNDFDSSDGWVWVWEFTWGIVKSKSIKVINNTQNYLI